MRFLADESCDYAVVRALSRTRHEVLAVAVLLPGASDGRVIELALRERCILLTEHKDFGQFVYASGARSVGVIPVRFPAGARSHMGAAVAELVDRRGDDLIGRFVVVQPGKTRIGPRLSE